MALLKSKILEVPMYSGEHYFDGWLLSRLGKFTASKIHTCMRPKGLGEGGVNYIRTRIGEELTGTSSEKNIVTEDILWGLKYEPQALRLFVKQKNIPADEQGRVPIIFQKLVCDKDSKFGCTPDGLWINSENEEKGELTVRSIEIKCYQIQNHVSCALCSTPAEIRIEDFEAYSQVIMQMQECGCLISYLVYFHPLFKQGGFRVIEFNAGDKEITADLKLLNTRKLEILARYEKEKEILTSIIS